MLNTSPRHTSGAHVRSPRGGRERGSSVPIMDAETRRRVDPFPGLGNPNPLWVQGLAQGSQPVYGPVPRGRTPARSPHGVATGAPQQTMGGPSFPPGLPQQAEKSFVITRTIHWTSSTCGDTITNITRRARVDETSARIGKHDAATGCAATAVYANDDFVHGAATAAASAVDDTAASATAATATATGESPLTSGWCS